MGSGQTSVLFRVVPWFVKGWGGVGQPFRVFRVFRGLTPGMGSGQISVLFRVVPWFVKGWGGVGLFLKLLLV